MMFKRILSISAISILTFSFSARAADCFDSFKTIGDPRNGAKFVASVRVPGLTPSSALGQVQQRGMDQKYQIGGELFDRNSGQLFLLEQMKGYAIVVKVDADGSGTVTTTVKLARDTVVSSERAQRMLCSLLTDLKTGPQGDHIAATARERSGTQKVRNTTARELSAEISKLNRKTQKFHWNGPDDLDATFAEVPATFMGRKYRIDGVIYSAGMRGKQGSVTYLVTQKLGLGGISGYDYDARNSLYYQIECLLPASQESYFKTLRARDYALLEGTITEVTREGATLTGCVQAN